MVATSEHLGLGIYSPEEAAFYARVSTRLMNRWIFGDKKGEPVVRPQLRPQEHRGEKVVTFLDFIQALAIRAIRLNYRIPLSKIREAVDRAREEFGVDYPLAVRHKTYLFSDQQRSGHGELVIRRPGQGGADQFVQLSGRAAGNLMMRQVIELYLDDVTFDPEDGLATEFKAWGTGDDVVTMNPRMRFGEPIVASCGYTAQTLWEASVIEGGLDEAADAYGVRVEDVKLACSFYDHLKSTSV